MDAARFLKKSQLSDVILSKIWDMADPQSRGSLDKSGLFVALKLCALAQTGKDLNMSNLSLELPPPKMVNLCVRVVFRKLGTNVTWFILFDLLGRYLDCSAKDYHQCSACNNIRQ